MKQILTVKERILLQQILPQQASMKELAVILECNKLLELTDAEKAEFGYNESGGTITWNPAIDTSVDVDLKHNHIAVLKEEIQKLDDAAKVTRQQYDVFLRIREL